MEHKGVLVKAEEMTGVCFASVVEQIGEIAASGRGGNPLSKGARWSIAVVVDGSGC
jgi:hypothetical protein